MDNSEQLVPLMTTGCIITLFASGYGNFAYTSGGGQSNWNYQYDPIGEPKILKLEWNNVGNIDHGKPYNHTINFQTWFYEIVTLKLGLRRLI